ncbi:transcription repressor NadR [Bacillus kexueae]|uniref:transcription repressor NadR n=1 Tax=Aeribacillus kexueae TaxID=2078952 RepID=UPI001FAF90D3|nr:transcription repressor NadR [Bacillus kexueae]
MNQSKILGEKRRELILKWLQEEGKPLTGGWLSSKTNVSRQVIVQDISLLKARGIPIVATSQGYVYMDEMSKKPNQKERLVVCKHGPEKAEEELQLIVDFGVTVKDVIVEHPVYGDLTASIMVSNRKEVHDFLKKIRDTNASFLSELSDGVHIHTLVAQNEEILDEVCEKLADAGILFNE